MTLGVPMGLGALYVRNDGACLGWGGVRLHGESLMPAGGSDRREGNR